MSFITVVDVNEEAKQEVEPIQTRLKKQLRQRRTFE